MDTNTKKCHSVFICPFTEYNKLRTVRIHDKCSYIHLTNDGGLMVHYESGSHIFHYGLFEYIYMETMSGGIVTYGTKEFKLSDCQIVGKYVKVYHEYIVLIVHAHWYNVEEFEANIIKMIR